MKGIIELTNIKLYAHHGCLPQETLIGSEYLVQAQVSGDFSKSAMSDELEDAIDYVLIQKIVAEEMKIPSKLLEHVAQRILTRFEKQIPQLVSASITISKLNPPINGNVEKVSVTLQI